MKKNLTYTQSTGFPHQSFDEEWLCHKRCSEWWYSTGYLYDENNVMYGFQYTILRIRIGIFYANVIQTALTDCETGKHYYSTRILQKDDLLEVTPTTARVNKESVITKEDNKLTLFLDTDDFKLDLNMIPQKDPVWHCEDGKLRMGLDKPKAKTYYYSWTNLQCNGVLTVDGVSHSVHGKGWFDKQGGPHNQLKAYTHWEWFSLRFFDDEEIMLFSFPQIPYGDGTYIKADGNYERLNNYTIDPLEFIQAGEYRFSSRWRVTLPGVKDEVYSIEPVCDGQLNRIYYELLAEIKDKSGKCVGYCFCELIPGARNEFNTIKVPKPGYKYKS